jgi:hypothetical protein
MMTLLDTIMDQSWMQHRRKFDDANMMIAVITLTGFHPSTASSPSSPPPFFLSLSLSLSLSLALSFAFFLPLLRANGAEKTHGWWACDLFLVRYLSYFILYSRA